MIHELKIAPKYFKDVLSGKKTFEIRKNDRPFSTGDLLALNEYDPETKAYTGASCVVYVDYILDDEEYCKSGYIIMSIKPCIVHFIDRPFNPGKMAADYRVPLVSGTDSEML